MTPTEKHRETAKDIAFDFDCDWTADGRRRGETEYRAAIDAIAAALANAEREGMKRAAEIAKAHYDARHAALARAHGMNIATAILSQAGEA